MEQNNYIYESKLPPELKGAVTQMKETKSIATTYPWPDMEVGDSVLFNASKGEVIDVLRRRVGGSAYHYGKLSDKKFATKLIPEENAFRVWRIK